MNLIDKLGVLHAANASNAEFYENRFLHFQERTAERFNIEVTRSEWQQLNLDIFMDADNVRWLDTGDSTQSSLYIVEYRGEKMLAAFSETAYAIMTVMPRNDLRLLHDRQGSYIQKARSAGDTAFRDQRQALAADLPNMTLDANGALIRPRVQASAAQEESSSQYQPFRDALADFKPKSRPVLSVVAKKDDGIDPAVAAAFARLARRLDEQEAEVERDTSNVEEEVAALETRIEQLLAGLAIGTMKRDFLAMSRKMAEEAFAKYRDGVFNGAAALSFLALLFAQQDGAAERDEPRTAFNGR